MYLSKARLQQSKKKKISLSDSPHNSYFKKLGEKERETQKE